MAVLQIIPPPVRLDAFRAGALDVRGVDFTLDLTPLNDQIQTLTSVTVVSRDDGAVLGAGDLAIAALPSPAWFEGHIVGWWQTSAEAIALLGSIDYRIVIKLNTVMGRELICDAMQLVVAMRG